MVEGLSKQLGLPPDKMAPSANALYWCAAAPLRNACTCSMPASFVPVIQVGSSSQR